MSDKIYTGSCHCGRVRFEIQATLDSVTECNCTFCGKRGALLRRVPADKFKLLSGQEHLAEYQFNTRSAKHFFCKHCGIHPFSNPRAAPEQYTVNVRCLDDFELDTERPEVRQFDGRNWEDAVKSFRFG